MSNINDERTRMLVKVSMLYYLDGLSQIEISEKLGISRPQISRMLSAAKSEGLVQITIKNPFSEEQEHERALVETFGIKNAVVIQVPGEANQQAIRSHLGRASAVLLDSVLKDKDIVGIMAGDGVNVVGEELNFFARKGLRFVPMVGGWGAEGARLHANTNARLFGEALKSPYYQLNAPAIVGSAQTRDVIAAEAEIAEVLQLARSATVALAGIGQVSEEATIVRSGNFQKQSIAQMKAKGAVANLCTSFLDREGKIVACEDETRMIGLTVEELRAIGNVMAIAHGKDKIEAIRAVLRGRWIDTLVTDVETAKGVLEFR
ncbi:sugar-binding transcriptional regulator [Paenibacillus sp. MMS18-CY102]|uniref:sugar-binding transcriptional regulator n=1 Tax=Paenibacillus sp. MMS18-CY102 TaxID=2682849 RepID=UPI0013664F16|nr:sugar-binding transcriptional regulator [Paenibacillus sp. MMS18-CY102]MWC30550.1 winged helix-turn-helix transcriptional regulator [Paenibacillus sp. MMS18-CY102]